MSETHEVVCDECGDTHSLNCGLVAKPRPPKTWTRVVYQFDLRWEVMGE